MANEQDAATRQKKDANRIVKRRATQACQNCRLHKVRCNVVEERPCMACRLDEIECVVVESRRNKKRRLVSHESPNAHSEVNLPLDEYHSSPRREQFNNPSSGAVNYATFPLQETTHPVAAPVFALPDFIKPLPAHFAEPDLVYLRSKGALDIPEARLRDELLRCYVQYVHPCLPLLNLDEILGSIYGDTPVTPVSLLLFQAIMFSGIATADIALLIAAGFSSRRDARRELFNRTRLLYDLDYEDDSISLIQSLTLMTYWKENPDGRKETHHWIEIAVSMAQKAALHEAADPSLSHKLQSLRKRLWWSVYIRDCEIALSTNRATLISDVDSSTAPLKISDFEILNPSKFPRAFGNFDSNADVADQQQWAEICAAKARLCVTASKMLMKTAAEASRSTQGNNANRRHMQQEDDPLQSCTTALNQWGASSPIARFNPVTSQDTKAATFVLLSHLHMFHNALGANIHRARVSRLRHSAEARGTVHEAFQSFGQAASNIIQAVSSVHSRGLVRFLPSSTITLLLPAIVLHLQHALSLDTSIRKAGLEGYSICMEAMSTLRDMYAAADYSTAFLQNALLDIPIGPNPSWNAAGKTRGATVLTVVPEPNQSLLGSGPVTDTSNHTTHTDPLSRSAESEAQTGFWPSTRTAYQELTGPGEGLGDHEFDVNSIGWLFDEMLS